MAGLIGTVRQVAGEVFAVASDGSRRALIEGDRLFAGEQLQTGASGAVAVRLAGGGEMTLGRGSSLELTPQILAKQAGHIATADELNPNLLQPTQAEQAQSTTDVQSSAAEASGKQPVQGDGVSLGGGHSAMLIAEVGGSVTPEIGFQTAGFHTVPLFPEGYAAGPGDPSSSTAPAFVAPLPDLPVERPVVAAPPGEPATEQPPVPPVTPPVEPSPPGEPPIEPPPVEPPPANHGVELSGGALTLNEAHLSGGSDSDGQALTQQGTFNVSAADGLRSLNVGGLDIINAGVVAGFPQSMQTASGNTFSVNHYDPVTGVVSYSYTLNGPSTHATGEGANSVGESIIVKAVDSDGDHASSTLNITIVDDVPAAECIEVSVNREPVCTNLLLIVDNSDSMKDPSGVDGLSRLELARQAINDLLNQYQDMGEVRVQIVTFNSQADVPSEVWVDVATAKGIIDGLQAGNGTNYDAALASAQTAFTSEGSLSGGQNLAYFFSDGNPTLSPTHSDPNAQPNPDQGDGISPGEEALWTAFLESHGINAFAIGLGTDISSTYLDPIAYNGSTGSPQNTAAVIVTDLDALSAVLSGTVQNGTSGSLLAGGSFGADGGFVQSVTVDGFTYSYDPQTGFSASAGANGGTFDAVSKVLTVTGESGGTLTVNMLNGAFGYTPSTEVNSAALTENIRYVLSDNDGDQAAAHLLIHVPGGVPAAVGPEAVADHVITNVLSPSLEVPAALLLANDVSANGSALSAAPTVFDTGWYVRGEGFSSGAQSTVDFSGTHDKDANQLKNLQRSDFVNTSALTALVVLNGYLGEAYSHPANAQDLYSVHLKAGESVTVDMAGIHDQIGIGWQMADGNFQSLDAGGSFTATEDSVYRILLFNQPETGQPNTGVDYTLNLSINYGSVDNTPSYESLYTVSDGHGGSDSAAVSINYQDGCTLLGTTGDDVLLGGSADDSLHGGDGNDVLSGGVGNNELFGDNGNDILFSGVGDEILDGGAGNNTASYELATSGVCVSTTQIEPQDTGGAGTDTLINIQNLIGSNYNDHLTGDYEANVINGGQGDDVLIGGLGNDTLTGGSGNDTFTWLAGDSGHDQVTDFSIGADTLDLSKLLQDLNAGSDSLDDYLHFKVTGSGADLLSSIEVGAGGDVTQTIDLAGVDLAAHYGVAAGSGGMVASGADTASIINGMLSDHSMRADVV